MAIAGNNAANVSLGRPKAGGAIFIAPIGTELPTAPDSTLDDSTFKCLGFVSEDGLTNSTDSSTTEIKEWGGNTVIRKRTSWGETYKFTLIEQRDEVFKFVFGDDNVTTENGVIKILHNANSDTENVIVIDVLLSGNGIKRIIIPRGSITELGDINYKAEDVIAYECTVGALPYDADGNASVELIKAGTGEEGNTSNSGGDQSVPSA